MISPEESHLLAVVKNNAPTASATEPLAVGYNLRPHWEEDLDEQHDKLTALPCRSPPGRDGVGA